MCAVHRVSDCACLRCLQCDPDAQPHQPRHSCRSKHNRVVSQGIQLPLEVFRTSNGRGWGVRCSCDIPVGTFVCDYVGRLLTDIEAVRIFGILVDCS